MDSQKQEFVLRRNCPFVHQNKHHYFIIYAALKSQSQKAIYITQSLFPPLNHI
jgi:hypothetical protein